MWSEVPFDQECLKHWSLSSEGRLLVARLCTLCEREYPAQSGFKVRLVPFVCASGICHGPRSSRMKKTLKFVQSHLHRAHRKSQLVSTLGAAVKQSCRESSVRTRLEANSSNCQMLKFSLTAVLNVALICVLDCASEQFWVCIMGFIVPHKYVVPVF